MVLRVVEMAVIDIGVGRDDADCGGEDTKGNVWGADRISNPPGPRHPSRLLLSFDPAPPTAHKHFTRPAASV
jgi:hypothetical protein